MPETRLALSSLDKKYAEINARAKKVIGEIVEVEAQIEKHHARLLRVLNQMYGLFKSKPAGTKLGGFDTFEEWSKVASRPLLHVKDRMWFHYLHVARNIAPKVTDEEIDRLGITKLIELSRLAETKRTVPKELIERAGSMTTIELHAEVKQIIWKGNPDHQDRTCWETLEIEGPATHTRWLKTFLNTVRRVEGYGPSDAEVFHLYLHNEYEELMAKAQAQRDKAAGRG